MGVMVFHPESGRALRSYLTSELNDAPIVSFRRLHGVLRMTGKLTNARGEIVVTSADLTQSAINRIPTALPH